MLDKKDVFKKFLDTNEVLIVDKNPSSRSRLLKTIYDLGAKRHMIHTTGNLVEAKELISSKNIGIVLSDYFVSGGSGFDLFNMIREKDPQNKELCLVLVTSNISQTAVAKAAEEDVDSFIIKPYTIQSIQENLITTVAQKIQPSDYIKIVNEGKSLISENKYHEAIQVLKKAIDLNPKPSLALFYIGQAEYLQKQVDNAATSYTEGLSFINIHYKCLVGLYELFIEDKKYEEAYQIVRKIAKYFPANPDRLAQIVRLAIRTKNFDDMQMYYEIYKTLDERAQILTNYMGAGMYVAGKHSLMKKSPDTALKYFDNIAVSCAEFTKFIRAIISALIEFDMPTDAEKYLGRFAPEHKDHADYLISEFLIASKKEENGFIIKMGLDLYNQKIRDYACLRVLLDAMEKGGYKEDKMAPFKKELELLNPSRNALMA
jgi:CheY-like chemotaxis protein